MRPPLSLEKKILSFDGPPKKKRPPHVRALVFNGGGKEVAHLDVDGGGGVNAVVVADSARAIVRRIWGGGMEGGGGCGGGGEEERLREMVEGGGVRGEDG